MLDRFSGFSSQSSWRKTGSSSKTFGFRSMFSFLAELDFLFHVSCFLVLILQCLPKNVKKWRWLIFCLNISSPLNIVRIHDGSAANRWRPPHVQHVVIGRSLLSAEVCYRSMLLFTEFSEQYRRGVLSPTRDVSTVAEGARTACREVPGTSPGSSRFARKTSGLR